MLHFKVFLCVLFIITCNSAMAQEPPQNLTKITWVHAVNDQAYLDSVLQDDNAVDMIEADVVFGHLINQTEQIPVMGHPPNTVSDLSLESFLSQVDAFNKKENVTVKGVKLDFKSIQAFKSAVENVQKYDNVTYPLWINADIVSGPVLSLTIPVDADQFLQASNTFPTKTVLSIGWTTNYGTGGIPPNMTYAAYDEHQMNKMLEKIITNNVTHEITFPVRAGIVANSQKLIQELMDVVPKSTLTIWSSAGDYVDVEKLRQLIADVGVDKIYVDVPEELLEKLHLGDLP
ncbi:protein FAM151A isoform X2 [Aethina tumida]|uniref:protein FAM151A isoform X2 n=1 Tax=Aethina tumida TaxID=116153 RepID=UPI00214931E3|nr:protein FAM151A isoform X2 [Aethina tumida]